MSKLVRITRHKACDCYLETFTAINIVVKPPTAPAVICVVYNQNHSAGMKIKYFSGHAKPNIRLIYSMT